MHINHPFGTDAGRIVVGRTWSAQALACLRLTQPTVRQRLRIRRDEAG
jgi:hypothetical protein